MIEKTITIFRNKKPKKPKIWTFGFFRFFKNLKNLGFLKATSTALDVSDPKSKKAFVRGSKSDDSFPYFAQFSPP